MEVGVVWCALLIQKNKSSSPSLSLLSRLAMANLQSLRHFELFYPASLSTDLLGAVALLDKQLNNEFFTKTFNVAESKTHEEILSKFNPPLQVAFTDPTGYNARIAHFIRREPSFAVSTAFGWYHRSVNKHLLHLNLNHFQNQLPHLYTIELPILVFMTLAHEIQHFLASEFKISSPCSPLPVDGEYKNEAGEAWEVKNLGGVLDTVVLNGDPFQASKLFLRYPWFDGLEYSEENLPYSYYQEILGVINGKRQLPIKINLPVQFAGGRAPVTKSKKFAKCSFDETDGEPSGRTMMLEVPPTGAMRRKQRDRVETVDFPRFSP